MPLSFYSILHVGSILLLTGITFAIFGGAPENRKKLLMALGGILSLVALFGGFGLASSKMGVVQQPNPAHWPLWIWIKVFCWLWLSAIGGIAYRRRNESRQWLLITVVILVTALVMVYVKPFVNH